MLKRMEEESVRGDIVSKIFSPHVKDWEYRHFESQSRVISLRDRTLNLPPPHSSVYEGRDLRHLHSYPKPSTFPDTGRSS